MLLVKNGAGGLVLVVAILYLFLAGRVAFWVAGASRSPSWRPCSSSDWPGAASI